MKNILLIVMIVLLACTVQAMEVEIDLSDGGNAGWKAEAAPRYNAPQYGYGPSEMKVPVQKVARPRPLTASEYEAVDDYLRRYAPKMSEVNVRSLRAGLPFLVGIDQSHVPLTRKPAEYLADYQTYTQLLERTEMYVWVPRQEFCLPEFKCSGSQGKLCLADIPPCKEEVVPCQTACPAPAGALRISRPGDREEANIAGAWWGWGRMDREHSDPPCPDPPDETCDPHGGPPPEQNPSGCNVLPTNGGTNNYVPRWPR